VRSTSTPDDSLRTQDFYQGLLGKVASKSRTANAHRRALDQIKADVTRKTDSLPAAVRGVPVDLPAPVAWVVWRTTERDDWNQDEIGHGAALSAVSVWGPERKIDPGVAQSERSSCLRKPWCGSSRGEPWWDTAVERQSR